MKHDLASVFTQFDLPGTFLRAAPYGSGHINDTYAVWSDVDGAEVRTLFQRINHQIFKDVPGLMDNIARTTRHLRAKLEAEGAGDLDRRTLTLIPTRDGADWLLDDHGLYWRAYVFIEGARTYDVIETPDQAREAARAFGAFQTALTDLPPPRLNETIPNFHHTRARYDALTRAIEADTAGRVKYAGPEIEFARRHESLVDVLIDLQAAGDLPERITHNDTKLNNVMIDDETGEGICVIDLDTVMPGLALYDFGDMIRTASNTGAEDERDLDRISCNPTMVEALLKGYLSSAGGMLTAAEIDKLVFSGKLITFEIGLRFLTDYLSGDVYFKTHREGHNLDRCRTQFKLVTSITEQEQELNRMVQAIQS